MTDKSISIKGKTNRYQMKLVTHERKPEKINTDGSQIELLDDAATKTNIIAKIRGYKQQDVLKGRETDLCLEHVLSMMRETELKCRYCLCDMLVKYETAREMRQWTVDRIDNDIGHVFTNCHLACLSCNLKRRRKTDAAFLFTKQLTVCKTL
jgi:hypothetical protein